MASQDTNLGIVNPGQRLVELSLVALRREARDSVLYLLERVLPEVPALRDPASVMHGGRAQPRLPLLRCLLWALIL